MPPPPYSKTNDQLHFAGDDSPTTNAGQPPWTVLIVDDDQDVHAVTVMSLSESTFLGRSLNLLHAYSGTQAKSMLRDHPETALVLLDVSMETDRAGLDVVEFTRNELGNRFVRIILRTGQPGQAPEREVITRYDINDYKHKTELTSDRLFSAVFTGLSTYQHLMALDATRCQLEQLIAQRREVHDRLQRLTRRHALALRAGEIGVWEWDLQTGCLSWDVQMHSIYGVPESSAVDLAIWKGAVLAEDLGTVEAGLQRAQTWHSSSSMEFRIQHPMDGIRFIESSQELMRLEDGTAACMVGVNRDITEQRFVEEQLRRSEAEVRSLSLADPLTGIANRRKLDEVLAAEVIRANRYGSLLSVAMVDLDYFKRINDRHGHEMGDAVLKLFAGVLRTHLRDTDLAARFGGDEFVIVMPESEARAATEVAQKIREILEGIRIPSLPGAVTASFGIAELQPGETAGAVLRRADRALYLAKAQGRNRVLAE